MKLEKFWSSLTESVTRKLWMETRAFSLLFQSSSGRIITKEVTDVSEGVADLRGFLLEFFF